MYVAVMLARPKAKLNDFLEVTLNLNGLPHLLFVSIGLQLHHAHRNHRSLPSLAK